MEEEYSDESLMQMEEDVMLDKIVYNNEEDLRFIDSMLNKAFK